MIRKQIFLTGNEVGKIKGYSKDLNISFSEYVRRVLDNHIDLRERGILSSGIERAVHAHKNKSR
jgi:hypothetical protein